MRAARARLRRRAAVRQLPMTSHFIELFVITLVAATVNGALGTASPRSHPSGAAVLPIASESGALRSQLRPLAPGLQRLAEGRYRRRLATRAPNRHRLGAWRHRRHAHRLSGQSGIPEAGDLLHLAPADSLSSCRISAAHSIRAFGRARLRRRRGDDIRRRRAGPGVKQGGRRASAPPNPDDRHRVRHGCC